MVLPYKNIIDQWKRTESEINLRCGQLILNKGVKNTQQRKDSLFSKWCWGNWISTHKRMKLDPYHIPHPKINSKQTRLKLRTEIIQLP